MNYRPVDGWGRLPDGWRQVEAAGVAVDKQDNVYLFTRSAHAVTIDAEGMVWLTDDLHHTIRKFTPEGKLLLTLGHPDQASELHGGKPFNRPTHVAICPKTGFLFISDGYGNSNVHKYTPEGTHVVSWGEPGTDPGQSTLSSTH